MPFEEIDQEHRNKIVEHDSKLIEMEELARAPCFDKKEFSQRIKIGDDWQKLIQAHLYLEFIASRMLEAELPNPNEIKLSRMGFSARLDLIAAMGLIPIDFSRTIRKVAALRNKVAHDLNFLVSAKQVSDLRNTIPQWLRQIAEQMENRESQGPLSLHEILEAIPLFFEMYRQQRAAHNARIRHNEERRKLVAAYAQHVLDTTGPNAKSDAKVKDDRD